MVAMQLDNPIVPLARRSLYRITSIDRLVQILESNMIYLSRPSNWKDAFENFISKVKYRNDGKYESIDYLNNIYGLCWTMSTESELQWRAYAPFNNGVRIKINPMFLLDSLVKQSITNEKLFHLKVVDYQSYQKFIVQLKDAAFLKSLYISQNKEQLLKFLFLKRQEFTSEQEARLIYNGNVDPTYKSPSSGFIPFKIDPIQLFQEIRFDPALPDEICEAYKKYFVRKGIKSKNIKRSMLYKYDIKTTIEISPKDFKYAGDLLD
jgi:hypothetical protein